VGRRERIHHHLHGVAVIAHDAPITRLPSFFSISWLSYWSEMTLLGSTMFDKVVQRCSDCPLR